jgi:hypothetical protein
VWPAHRLNQALGTSLSQTTLLGTLGSRSTGRGPSGMAKPTASATATRGLAPQFPAATSGHLFPGPSSSAITHIAISSAWWCSIRRGTSPRGSRCSTRMTPGAEGTVAGVTGSIAPSTIPTRWWWPVGFLGRRGALVRAGPRGSVTRWSAAAFRVSRTCTCVLTTRQVSRCRTRRSSPGARANGPRRSARKPFRLLEVQESGKSSIQRRP